MKALSLFSGIGGIDLACEWAGIETVAFCEREPFPQKVLRKHWPDVPIYDDVCTLTKERLNADGFGTIDLIHGGYPCQPFSLAGKRKGKKDDRHLWPEMFRLIQAIQPRWVIGENVAGHITLGLDIVLADLDSIGYAWESFVIPAAGVNAPHRRERVFIVAHSNFDLRRWPERTGPDSLASQIRKDIDNEGYPKWDAIERGGKVKTEAPGLGQRKNGERQTNESTDVRFRDQWSVEPNVDRVADGVPDGMDRLKALGNSVVPHQIYPILAAIKQIDDLINARSAPESTEST